MMAISFTSPKQVSTQLAAKVKALRLEQELTRNTLSERSGVSVGSLKRFEETGEVSLSNLLKLAAALKRLKDFEQLLEPEAPQSLKDLERKPRQRGRV